MEWLSSGVQKQEKDLKLYCMQGRMLNVASFSWGRLVLIEKVHEFQKMIAKKKFKKASEF